MARIATNHAIDYKRKKEREKVELSLSNETQEDIKSSHNIEALLLRKEQKLLIAQKLRELPENYRDVVLAHYLEEKSYQEIAAQQNTEVKTVEMKLYRARKWIKKHWKEETSSITKKPSTFHITWKVFFYISALIPSKTNPIIKPQTAPFTRIHCKSLPTLFSIISISVLSSNLSRFSCTSFPILE